MIITVTKLLIAIASLNSLTPVQAHYSHDRDHWASDSQNETPIVRTQNGSINGLYISEYNQDAYLGIPYAEPPLGSLRFAPPQPYNESWKDVQTFNKYNNVCLSTISSQIGHTDNEGQVEDEDCLFINVVKPHGNYTDLPVGVWIHGGGFVDGSGSRQAYNLSFIVEKSVEIGKPFIGVSFNYRLGGFGFLSSGDISNAGWTNVGLRDQLKAISWVHENIEDFGGDPDHLVLWGESAGAASVGKLLITPEIVESGYIKGGILESGSAPFKNSQVGANPLYEDDYQRLLSHFNFNDSTDSISALQTVDAEELRAAFNTSNGVVKNAWIAPYTDGDIVPKSSYQSLKNGEYLKVPILIGTNTDEGTGFTNISLNSTEDFRNFVLNTVPFPTEEIITKLDELYPRRDPANTPPLDPTFNKTPIVYPSTIGEDFGRAAYIFGDIFFSATARKVSEILTKDDVPVFKYRFNIPNLSLVNTSYIGATHFQEVVYVFNNDQAPASTNQGGTWYPDARSSNVSSSISKLWVSFITDLDPNVVIEQDQLEVGIPDGWKSYADGAKNAVFDLNGFYLEDDNWREEPINYLESIHRQLNW